MPLLYYWQPDNYRRDAKFGFGYHLSQNSPTMSSIAPGDSIWAFTRRRNDGMYVLAAELIVKAVTHNAPNYRYGTFRAWGDLERSRYFDVDLAPNADPLVRALSVRVDARRLGQSFQGYAAVRALNEADQTMLTAYAHELPQFERVHLYPEDEFEARLIHGTAARPLLVREEAPTEANKRRAYLFETVNITRARRNVETLQTIYAGRCQVCLYDPRVRYRHNLCHGHHIEWLSRGGEDHMENMVLVCPNHHAAIHRADAAFDYATHTFMFQHGMAEHLQLNTHLPAA